MECHNNLVVTAVDTLANLDCKLDGTKLGRDAEGAENRDTEGVEGKG